MAYAYQVHLATAEEPVPDPGDILLLAGKGHETGQYVGGSVLPFDDRQVTAAALAARAPAFEPWAVNR